MSCSVCLLPFVPAARSMFPRPPPPGVVTPQQGIYLQTAYGIGRRMVCGISRYDYLDNNMFGSAGMMFLQWESENGTFFMMHTACANILRHVVAAQCTSRTDKIVKLCEIEAILGRPQAGKNAARLRFVPYEDVGPLVDRVDIRPFWKQGDGLGLNLFLWKEFANSSASWALAKPDVFPRFFPQMKPERLSSIGQPVSQPGILTRQPLDVLLLLLPHLTLPAFLALTSTCRLIRLHALTTFQPRARQLVLSLGWATPLLGSGEYEAAISNNPSAAESLVHDVTSPLSGDWMLYLSHVHRTSSMRARRRIWNICEAIKQTVDEKFPSSEYCQNFDVERAKLETNATFMSQAADTMRNLTGKGKGTRRSAANATSPGGLSSMPMEDLRAFMNNMPNFGL